MKTRSAKAKGRATQNATRDALLRFFPELAADDVQTRTMGVRGEDLILSPAARRLLPLSIECKNTRGAPGRAAITQARSNASGHVPVVVWHPPRTVNEYLLVTLTLQDLLSLMRGR